MTFANDEYALHGSISAVRYNLHILLQMLQCNLKQGGLQEKTQFAVEPMVYKMVSSA